MSKSEINDFIRARAETHSDKQIADLLGAQGIKTTKAAVTQRRQNMGIRKSRMGNGGIEGSRESVDPPKSNMGKLAALLEKSGIPIDEIDNVQTVRINTYQALTKNDDGEAEIHNLEAASLVLKPKWAGGPEWPVIQQAAPVRIAQVKVNKKDAGGFKTALILPDVQIGYRRQLQTGLLDPFHCEKAMDIALQMVRELQPDVIVNLGDLLDLSQFSKYIQEAGFALTTQPALDRAHTFLAQQRALAPNADIRLLEGNHSRRLPDMITKNALAAYGLTRANSPEEWPVMSVPHLLRLDELGVEFIGGYPAGITWINDRLACIHGHKAKSGASTAAAVVDDERVSVIFGHIHRREWHERTRRTREGARTSAAISPGCLCRIDGAVPSTKGSTDLMGRPIPSPENWQNGLLVVTYGEGDQPFAPEMVPIHHGVGWLRGKPYFAKGI